MAVSHPYKQKTGVSDGRQRKKTEIHTLHKEQSRRIHCFQIFGFAIIRRTLTIVKFRTAKAA
jgi:two-component SAPR family response regulator